MGITELYSNTASISVTEISLTTGGTFSANTGIGTDGVYQVYIDAVNMTASEQYEIKIYESCLSTSTQRQMDVITLTGAQANPLIVLPSLIFLHRWDITLKKLAGTDRNFSWSIRQIA